MSKINIKYRATEALNRKTPKTSFDIYGKNVFSLKVMKELLSKDIFSKIENVINNGSKLDIDVAEHVANTMKNWALAKGATHFSHVFFPLTGSTAEKHDSFLNVSGLKDISTRFSGKELIQGEPDASSFPNGGLRGTFEARGYTIWDITSPAYLMEYNDGVVLCIPTSFVSWTGQVLDQKAPVLRSMVAINKASQDLLKTLGYQDVDTVYPVAGPEQEYFLIDKNFYNERLDLIMSGRTIFGTSPSKGQEFSDHYFGMIPERVNSFMFELEQELMKLGIPVKTRHNEVAPGQFEIAPIHERANIAMDHQQLTMHMIKRIAKRHNFSALLHEKPFAGINGSGKHLNWSIGNSKQGNLLNPEKNYLRFLVFCSAIIRALNIHSGLLRATIASAGNDHRLGANEAPPAIISIFLRDALQEIFEKVERGEKVTISDSSVLDFGVDSMPSIPKDSGDRNRTSPFAFTSNRFEFRALGSNQSISYPLMALNTIVSDSLQHINEQLKNYKKSFSLKESILKVVKENYSKHKRIIFNGDGYSEEWHKEAVEKRKLPQFKTTPDALTQLIDKKTIDVFTKFKILTKKELESRYNIHLSQYVMKINVEISLALKIARTNILPQVISYQKELAANHYYSKSAGLDFPKCKVLERVFSFLKELYVSIENLQEKFDNKPSDLVKEANYTVNTILPALEKLRNIVDILEVHLPISNWSLPSYEEMLFIK